MKKLVLIIFCTAVIGVFIGFNYLLWDREDKVNSIKGLESINAANDSSINALSRQIKTLEDEKDELDDRIRALQSQILLLGEEKNSLQAKVDELGSLSASKDNLIYGFKQQADVELLAEPVAKWVEALDKGEYKSAFDIYSSDPSLPDRQLDLNGFTQLFKDTLKTIKLKSCKLYMDENDTERMGELVLETILEVKNQEKVTAATAFTEGENMRYFTLRYDEANKSWTIAKIASIP